jgi:hypothetical protein
LLCCTFGTSTSLFFGVLFQLLGLLCRNFRNCEGQAPLAYRVPIHPPSLPNNRAGRSRDLQFWGGTLVWIISLGGKMEPRPVTQKSVDETYDLRWLDDHTLLFDRVADVVFYKQSHIWKADVPR